MTRKSDLAKKNQQTFSRFVRKRDQTPTKSIPTNKKDDLQSELAKKNQESGSRFTRKRDETPTNSSPPTKEDAKCMVFVKRTKEKVEEKGVDGYEADKETKQNTANKRNLFTNQKKKNKNSVDQNETRDPKQAINREKEDSKTIDIVKANVSSNGNRNILVDQNNTESEISESNDIVDSLDTEEYSIQSEDSDTILNEDREPEPESYIEEKRTEEIKEKIEEEMEKDPNIVLYEKIAKVFKEGKEVFYNEFGEPDVLKIQPSIPVFTKSNAVVVRVEASSISITDCELRRNMNRNYIWPILLPNKTGQDLVGRIVHVGERIQKNGLFHVGERVCSLHQYLGGNSRYVTLSPNRLVRVPDNVDVAQAACVVRSYLAAFQILYRSGQYEIGNGHRILVTGANGNIGRAVIDLARRAKAKVYGASGSRHKDFVQYKLGATWVHSDPRSWDRVTDLNVVVDTVNYTGNFNDSKGPLVSGGILFCVGSAKYVSEVIRDQKRRMEEVEYDYDSDQGTPVDMICGTYGTASRKKAVYSSNVFSHMPLKYNSTAINFFVTTISFDFFKTIESQWNKTKDDLEYLLIMLQRGKIKPIVQHRVALNEVAVAHSLVEAGGLQGAIVCVDDKLNSKNVNKK